MVDVCLVTDGAWPHSHGGVAVWTDRLVRALPEVSFGVARIGGSEPGEGEAVFATPPNVREVVQVAREGDALLCSADAHERLPEARVYHAVITGAASELAERAADEADAPLLVTEHGLAWRDVRIWGSPACPGYGGGGRDDDNDDDNDDNGNRGGRRRRGQAATLLSTPVSRLSPSERAERRALVNRRADAVEALARRAYARAEVITSVCTTNARHQRALGAPADRLRVIGNAAPRSGSEAAAGAVAVPGRFRVGFVGRVVPVKDVMTFLRACALLAEDVPALEVAVVGPEGEQPGYARRCRQAASALGLADRVTFTGATDAAAWYGRLDAVALTSVSEAQPLVLLEAMAAGVPVVATAVGGVPELVGGAGFLVRPRDPLGVAGALLTVHRDPALAATLAAAARRRVTTRHDPRRIHRAYHEVYESLAPA